MWSINGQSFPNPIPYTQTVLSSAIDMGDPGLLPDFLNLNLFCENNSPVNAHLHYTFLAYSSFIKNEEIKNILIGKKTLFHGTFVLLFSWVEANMIVLKLSNAWCHNEITGVGFWQNQRKQKSWEVSMVYQHKCIGYIGQN